MDLARGVRGRAELRLVTLPMQQVYYCHARVHERCVHVPARFAKRKVAFLGRECRDERRGYEREREPGEEDSRKRSAEKAMPRPRAARSRSFITTRVPFSASTWAMLEVSAIGAKAFGNS